MAEGKFGLIGRIASENNLSDDINLYKFSTFEHFLNSIEGKYLYFNKITLWDDKWEIPGSLIEDIDKDCSSLFKSVVNDNCKYYGNCFSIDYQCDAFWNRYKSKDEKDTVCFSIKAGNLLDKCKYTNEINFALLGKVIYKEIEFIDDIIPDKDNAIYPLEYILPYTKRKSFSYEKEVRFIVDSDSDSDSIKIEANLKDMIDKIIISNLMPKIKKDKLTELINKELPNTTLEEYDCYDKKPLRLNNKEEFEHKIRDINTGSMISKLKTKKYL